ncbi:MAG: hypothetical protein J0M05_06080 [Candidatus Kapabacteria bacterium]|jgi:hypothetical protein|nr:hypothetical protein [Candidatus Kapabacteria bacterium]
MIRFLIAILLSVSIAFLGSCSKDEDNPTGGGTSSKGSLSATIDGIDWTADLTIQGTYNNKTLAFAGSGKDSKQINITMSNIDKAGVYTLGSISSGSLGSAILTLAPNADAVYSTFPGLSTGTLTIEKLTSTEAEGTFSFTGRNTKGVTKNVTNGTFKVSY